MTSERETKSEREGYYVVLTETKEKGRSRPSKSFVLTVCMCVNVAFTTSHKSLFPSAQQQRKNSWYGESSTCGRDQKRWNDRLHFQVFSKSERNHVMCKYYSLDKHTTACFPTPTPSNRWGQRGPPLSRTLLDPVLGWGTVCLRLSPLGLCSADLGTRAENAPSPLCLNNRGHFPIT